MPRRCKDWLRRYLQYTAHSESPEIFHFWTGVSAIAGAVRRRVWIDMDAFEWTPNFYIILVAPAGVVSKSTTIRLGINNLLAQVDGIHMGPSSATWQSLGEKLSQAQELVARDPTNLEGEMEQMSCLTCAISELGTFFDFRDGKLISFLTDVWDGQRTVFEHSTKTQGSILIQNPWLNLIGATTPSWLSQNVPESMIYDGLGSRIIFAYGQKKRHLTALPGLMRSKDERQKHEADLIHDLNEMAQMIGEMFIDPETIPLIEKWYLEHNTSRDIALASDRFGGYIARKQTHIMKLAMVLSISESSEGVIAPKHFDAALQIMNATEKDMLHVFGAIGGADEMKHIRQLMSFIWIYQEKDMAVSRQLLWRHAMQSMSQEEFASCTDAAVQAGYLRIHQQDSNIYYYCLVNPMTMEETS